MENELSPVVDALPGLVWTALPDGSVDFLIEPGANTPALALTKLTDAGGRPRSIPKICLSYSSAGDPFWPPASRVKWKRACGASMESIAGLTFRARPLVDASGQIVKWCGLNTDIEDR